MVLSWVYATKKVATAPSLTILVLLPHVLSNGVQPFLIFYLLMFFFVFGGFLGVVTPGPASRAAATSHNG